jgi:hypothetical protein
LLIVSGFLAFRHYKDVNRQKSSYERYVIDKEIETSKIKEINDMQNSIASKL